MRPREGLLAKQHSVSLHQKPRRNNFSGGERQELGVKLFSQQYLKALTNDRLMKTRQQGMGKEITGSSPMYKTKKLVER